MAMKKLALATKRGQVDKAKATLFAIVAGASVITVFALIASKTYLREANYLNKIASNKETALTQLKANKEAVSKLVESYKTFASQDPNLIGGKSTANGERDGDNARLILDALPSKYDFPALVSSVEKLLNGYTINGITGSDDSLAIEQAKDKPVQLVEMPFTLDINTDYKGAQNLVTSFERSIRPFQVQTMEFNGSNAKLQILLNVKTFYQPEKDLKIDKKVIK